MNKIIKLEEAAMFIATLLLISHYQFSGWLFAACFLLPDLGMLGYLHNPHTGAISYNLFHHKGIALALWVAGVLLHLPGLIFAGLLLFSHASFDRMLGYGLKFKEGFAFTHMGKIGRDKANTN